ncbi:MAG: 5-guanidino-2-oxopentanoate decarboxylase [Ilumatobacteraceae bacterium]
MTRLRVGEAVVDLLARHYGVDVVFGIPGVHNIELYRGLHRSGVRAVSPRHEQGAGFMADGWSIVTGRPGVCTLISGPGLTNALTPMAQAFHDSRPMLVLAATTDTGALGRRFGPLHDLDDQACLARTVTAFSETVLDPTELPALIARAWDVFTSQRPRPVHLAIPTDVLERLVDPFEPAAPLARRPAPLAAELDRAADLLRAARAPGATGDVALIVGGGAIDAGPSVLALAERLDAVVVLTGNAKGVVASSHPRCAGNVLGIRAVQEAIEAMGTVVVIGSEVSDTDLYNGGHPLAFAGRVLRIDLDVEQLPRRMVPDATVVADARLALDGLTTRLADLATAEPSRGAHLAAAWRELGAPAPALAPWVEAIAATLTDDTIVALDSTQLAYAAHVALPCARPRSWLAPYGLGTLGCALPMAIGAKLAASARPVLALAGDGGWLFTVAEMAVAVDEDLDLVLVLWDNRGYAQIRQSFDDANAARMGVDVTSADPAALARGFGWRTAHVTTPDALTATIFAARVAGGPHMVVVRA